MTTPTRRISFYLKPTAVKNEGEACAGWTALHQKPAKAANAWLFLAGLALLKNESGRGLPTGCMG
ncbi:plasmid partitioning/stability family protein [Escherichia coli]